MSESLGTALLTLKRLVASSRGRNVPALDAAVSNVMKFNDSESIGFLLRLLRDDSLYDEGVFSLVHAAESFDDETYVRRFLEVVPELVKEAPSWASVLIVRIINNDSARGVLIGDLREAPISAKNAVAWLLESINNEDSSFIVKTMAPLLAAKGA